MPDPIYIRLGLTVRGPYSMGDLHELARRGGFSKSHEVSTNKQAWTPASDHPHLFPAVRTPQLLDRNKRNTEAADLEKNDESPGAHSSVSPSAPRHRPAKTEKSFVQTDVDPASVLAGENHVPIRPLLSSQAISTVVLGPAGFILLMVCTAMIVMRLRVSAFVPANNLGFIALLVGDLLFGVAAVAMGHLAIHEFQKQAGTVRERNLIVIGLSCGYTILILIQLFVIVLLISALG